MSLGPIPIVPVLMALAVVSAGTVNQDLPPSAESGLAAELDRTPLPDSLGLRVGVLRFQPKGDRIVYRIFLEVPISDLVKVGEKQEGTVTAECAFLARVLDTGSNRVERFSRLVSKEIPVKDVKTGAAERVSLAFAAPLSAGSYVLEAVGRDPTTHKSAVRRRRFAVPAVDDGVAVSSLVLLRSTEPVPLGGLDPSDGLQFHGKWIIPNFSGIVRKLKGGKVRLYMVIYPDDGLPYVPQLGIEFSRDGRIAGAAQPRLPKPDEFGNIAFIIEFPTSQFEVGNYIARAVIRQGNSEAESSVPFRVVNR